MQVALTSPRCDEPAPSRSERTFPLWIYPQILSLDAPAIAVVWEWFFAKCFHVPTSPAMLFATAACVWMIYAADHLLDVRNGAIYSARHAFVARHSRTFVTAAIVVFAAATAAAWQFPLEMWIGAMQLTGVVGVYLGFVHLLGERTRRYWPKEFAISAIFAAGSSLATWTSVALRVLPAVLLFAGLCALNCCVVDYWEWQTNRVLLRYPQSMTRIVARHFVATSTMVAAATYAFAPTDVALAILLSLLLLLVLYARRSDLAPELFRLLADAALLTPTLFLWR